LYLVSNEVPEHPVVSPVSGAVFERRLIEKYIADNGVDPINGKELTAEQLIEIKSKLMENKQVCSCYYICFFLSSSINSET
jgi:U-box domain